MPAILERREERERATACRFWQPRRRRQHAPRWRAAAHRRALSRCAPPRLPATACGLPYVPRLPCPSLPSHRAVWAYAHILIPLPLLIHHDYLHHLLTRPPVLVLTIIWILPAGSLLLASSTSWIPNIVRLRKEGEEAMNISCILMCHGMTTTHTFVGHTLHLILTHRADGWGPPHAPHHTTPHPTPASLSTHTWTVGQDGGGVSTVRWQHLLYNTTAPTAPPPLLVPRIACALAPRVAAGIAILHAPGGAPAACLIAGNLADAAMAPHIPCRLSLTMSL